MERLPCVRGAGALATEGLFPPCQNLSLQAVRVRRFLVVSFSSSFLIYHARNDRPSDSQDDIPPLS